MVFNLKLEESSRTDEKKGVTLAGYFQSRWSVYNMLVNLSWKLRLVYDFWFWFFLWSFSIKASPVV